MDAAPETPPTTTRRVLWSAAVFFSLFWVLWIAFAFVFFIGCQWLAGSVDRQGENVIVLFAALVALLVVGWIIRRGLRLGSARHIGWLRFWIGAAVVSVALNVAAGFSFLKTRQATRHSAVMGNLRQLSAAADQFFHESPNRIFVGYDELVGPDRFLKSQNTIEGEDYRILYPMRRDQTDILATVSFVMPDGSRIQSPYLPPPKPDGIDVVQLSKGGRFEITYRGGVPDGAFRAFYEDGKPWGEATYRNGRVIEAWLIGRDGRRFDELKGEAPP